MHGALRGSCTNVIAASDCAISMLHESIAADYKEWKEEKEEKMKSS